MARLDMHNLKIYRRTRAARTGRHGNHKLTMMMGMTLPKQQNNLQPPLQRFPDTIRNERSRGCTVTEKVSCFCGQNASSFLLRDLSQNALLWSVLARFVWKLDLALMTTCGVTLCRVVRAPRLSRFVTFV